MKVAPDLAFTRGSDAGTSSQCAADGVRFTWPRTGTPWDTALLAVRSWGAEHDPYVEVSVGQFRIQQYLDANAVGVRWLNLSSLREQLAGQASVVTVTAGNAGDMNYRASVSDPAPRQRLVGADA